MYNQETEKIIGKVFEEQFLLKKGILCYNLSDISELYHIPILENIKRYLMVVQYRNQTHIDWIDTYAKFETSLCERRLANGICQSKHSSKIYTLEPTYSSTIFGPSAQSNDPCSTISNELQ